MENFALENLNEHRKGLLGKTLAISDMLTWSKVRELLLDSHVVLVVNSNDGHQVVSIVLYVLQYRILQ